MTERIWRLDSVIQQIFFGYLPWAIHFEGILKKNQYLTQATNNIKRITLEVKLKEVEVKPGYKKSQREQCQALNNLGKDTVVF